MTYTITYNRFGHPVIKRSDGAQIPIDDKNKDFTEFLKWNSEQKTPLDWETQIEPTPVTTDGNTALLKALEIGKSQKGNQDSVNKIVYLILDHLKSKEGIQ